MDHAKFCTVTQAMVHAGMAKPFDLLRRCFLNKQEEDHVGARHAMALRGRPRAKAVAN